MNTSLNEWVEKIRKKSQVKTYRHFDSPLNLHKQEDFEKLLLHIKDINNHQFFPLLKRDGKTYKLFLNKKGKLKKKTKKRLIMYSTHLDSNIYSYFNFLLSNIYEDQILNKDLYENIIGYRSMSGIIGNSKNNVDFAKDVFNFIKQKDTSYVLCLDVSNFFDNLKHKILIQNIKNLYNGFIPNDIFKVINSLCKYRYIEQKVFIKEKLKTKFVDSRKYFYENMKGYIKQNSNNFGIPQGSPMSGLLSNIYMINFDYEISNTNDVLLYRRYSDDIIIVMEGLNNINKIINLIIEKMKSLGLTISEKKTNIFKFQNSNLIESYGKDFNRLNKNSLDYLGLEFNKEIRIRGKTLHKSIRKNKSIYKKNLLKQKPHIINKNKKKKPRSLKNKNFYFLQSAAKVGNRIIRKQSQKTQKKRFRKNSLT